MKPARTETYEHTISLLLSKRQELSEEIHQLRERIAFLANNVEAIDRALDSFGHNDHREGRSPTGCTGHSVLSERASYFSS